MTHGCVCAAAGGGAGRDAVKCALSRDHTVGVPDALVRRVFEICDTNRDGVIAFDEFARHFCKCAEPDRSRQSPGRQRIHWRVAKPNTSP